MTVTTEHFTNVASTTLAATINASVTSFGVKAGEGAVLPSGNFRLILGDASPVGTGNYEICWVATRSGDTLSGVVRAYEDATAHPAQNWPISTPVTADATAGSLQDFISTLLQGVAQYAFLAAHATWADAAKSLSPLTDGITFNQRAADTDATGSWFEYQASSGDLLAEQTNHIEWLTGGGFRVRINEQISGQHKTANPSYRLNMRTDNGFNGYPAIQQSTDTPTAGGAITYDALAKIMRIGDQASDSAKLGGTAAASYLLSATAATTYLGISAQAADSAKLGGSAANLIPLFDASGHMQATDPGSHAPTPASANGNIANVALDSGSNEFRGVITFDVQTATIASATNILTVTFANAFPNANYVVMLTEVAGNTSGNFGAISRTTTSFTIRNGNATLAVGAGYKLAYILWKM